MNAPDNATPAPFTRPYGCDSMSDALIIAMQSAGFYIENTGGGCTTWAKTLPNDCYLWITSDLSHDLGPDDELCMGIYTGDADCIFALCGKRCDTIDNYI
jgi:hypothetical protein